MEIGNAFESRATKKFTSNILAVMQNLNPAIVTGGVYALESSAVPELDMVYKWVEKFFASKGKKTPSKITTFFRSHVDEIEIGHEARLREVCLHYINSNALEKEFKLGFDEVLITMDEWWQDLLTEANSRLCNNSMNFDKEQMFA